MPNIDFKLEDRLTLSPQNLKEVLDECFIAHDDPRATSEDAKRCYWQENSTQCILCSRTKLKENLKKVRYMLGQLHAVHSDTSTMTLAEAMLNFKKQNWTRNPAHAIFLIMLGNGCNLIPLFKGDVCGIHDYGTLAPTNPETDNQPHRKPGGPEPADN